MFLGEIYILFPSLAQVLITKVMKKIILTLGICLIGLMANAVNGCLVNGVGMFYQGPLSNNAYFTGGAYYVSAAECSNGLSPSNSYYSVTN